MLTLTVNRQPICEVLTDYSSKSESRLSLPLRGRIHISYIETVHMNAKDNAIAPPPIMTNHAEFGLSLVNHHDEISMIRIAMQPVQNNAD
jgi:hypothetical protein